MIQEIECSVFVKHVIGGAFVFSSLIKNLSQKHSFSKLEFEAQPACVS